MKVDFYVIEQGSKMQALRKLGEILEQPYSAQEPVFIHTTSNEDAALIDQVLWTYREDSFLAHQIIGESENSAPISIGVNHVPENTNGILVNFGSDIPDYHVKFARVIEVVYNDEQVQQAGRERFRKYRSAGYEINTYKTK